MITNAVASCGTPSTKATSASTAGIGPILIKEAVTWVNKLLIIATQTRIDP